MTNPVGPQFEIGPQYERDDSFTARMRFHQSWFRAAVLKIPYGTGPRPSSTRLLGSMLTREHGEQGLNFLTKEIFEQALDRVKAPGAVEPFRLLHNMLSSQPMCFNLFAGLARDLKLATCVFKQLINDIEQVTAVKLEYAPQPASDYLADRTAFDAFIEFTDRNGNAGFIGVETKLTEPFSQKLYDGQTYRRWQGPGCPWLEQSYQLLGKLDYNQLWRGHLLAYSMTKQKFSRYERGYFMVLRHPLDIQCHSAGQAYRQLLKAEDKSFIPLDLESFIKLTEPFVSSSSKEWIDNFGKRYLNLSLSESAWSLRIHK